MRELAQALGVSPMTPYRYFKDKDAILAAVRAAAFERFAVRLEAALTQPADPLHRSRNAGEAYVAFALAEPQAYRLMFDLNQPTEGDYPELQAAIVRARRTMTSHVQAMIDAGLLDGDAELIGHSLLVGAARHAAAAADRQAGPDDRSRGVAGAGLHDGGARPGDWPALSLSPRQCFDCSPGPEGSSPEASPACDWNPPCRPTLPCPCATSCWPWPWWRCGGRTPWSSASA
ncbi:TetR/AcrR family transcriptional regulator [Caulobacter segnis]